MITVITTVYNEKKYQLVEAIESILNQTYKDLEYIIVLDNPKNKDLLSVLKEYESKNSFIKLICNDENKGLAKSLNIALEVSNGDFIARLDADDWCDSYRLEKQLNHMKKTDSDLVFCGRYNTDEDGNIIGNSSFVNILDEDIPKLLKFGNFITHSSIMLKKDILAKVDGYSNYITTQDYDLYLKLCEINCKFSELKEYLIYYRVRETSISNKNLYKDFLIFNYIVKNRKPEDVNLLMNYLANKDVSNEIKSSRINKKIKKLNNLVDSLSKSFSIKKFVNLVILSFSSRIVFTIFFRMVRFQMKKRSLRKKRI